MTEKLRLGGVDEIVGVARAWLHLLGSEDGVVRLGADGCASTVPVHADWRCPGGSRLLGRAWDLKDAYKQLAVCERD
eukprot:9482067-Alexandrium_andersonii.AAC.1